MHFARALLTRAVAFLALTVPSSVALGGGVVHPVEGDPVVISSGKLSGTLVDPSAKAYLGIPFAAPPVRENRWREPQPVKPWSGTYSADSMKPECPQGQRSPSINHYFGEEAVSEDCLYLNVWAPSGSKSGDKLPVVVWIYGGAFNVGSASSPIYSGEPLAKRGVIYVSANYRLGVFGFLAHPDLAKETKRNASGNWGFLDQVAALRWIQQNISAFGGDPDNVTLIGQSAGAMSINNLQASPLARGLFAKVFGMSGATVEGGPGGAAGISKQRAEELGIHLQESVKANHIAELRQVSWDKILSAAQSAHLRFGPSIDGYFLPDTPQHIFEAGKQSDVPVVAGSTANDIGTNVPIRRAKTLSELRAIARRTYGEEAQRLLELWPAVNDQSARQVAEEIGQNSGFGLGAWNWANMQAMTGTKPSYLFMVTRVQPFTPGAKFSDFDPLSAGAYHMSDVPYFLGTYDAFNLFRVTRDWTELDRSLSTKMQDVIVAFARTGNPNTTAVKFVRFDHDAPERTVFGDHIGVEKVNGTGIDFLMQVADAEVDPSPPAASKQTF